MTYSTLEFTLTEGIGRIRLNRPDRLNAMSLEMIGEIIEVIDKCAADGECDGPDEEGREDRHDDGKERISGEQAAAACHAVAM